MLKHQTKVWVTPSIITFAGLILIIDSSTIRGTADYIFYFIPVALTVFHAYPLFPFIVAIGCTVLIVIGFYLSPSNTEIIVGIPFINRAFAIACMWGVALLVKNIISQRNEVEKATWIKTKSNELAAAIRGELSVKEVSHKLINFFVEAVGFQVGSLHIRQEGTKEFHYIEGHAYTPDESKKIIRIGEGLAGQVAFDKQWKLLSPLDPHHVKVSTALGESHLKHILLLPLVGDDQTIGLMELAFTDKPLNTYLEFLTQVSGPAAIAIRSAQHKAKLSELLLQAQRHAEELQSQQEELRVINEELEQQSKALKESHVRLENQQAEMEQTNQQLEEQTQELEHQKNLLKLKNAELETKSIEIKKSSNYKSEFLANMSHELRTPLNSSLILAKLLMDNRQGNLTKEQIEFAQIIYNSGNDLLNLINDILDLSKVEAGKMTIVPEMVLIETVIKHLEQTFKPVSLQKSLDFKIHIDENVPPEFITDRQRLEQILKNFLSNAFKFTHHGGVSLHVYMQEQKLAFSVADTGVGMAPHEQEIIFEAFRQADGTTNRKYGGTGLGLSISKELAHVLGGEITVRSMKGEGSTFTLTLPLELSSDKKESPKPTLLPPKVIASESSPATPRLMFQDDRDNLNSFARRMLIIEDDENFARILFDLAHEMNFGAIVTDTGEEGLHFAKAHQPNAIVLDIRLPDHSGMIVLDQLKNNAKTRHIPVHVISSEDFSRSALEMGAIGYILKPVKKEELQVAFQNMASLLEQKMKHVLVVEDDQVQRQYITQLIKDQKVEVTSVETSEAALKELSHQTFDCMIMDLSLPDMSGHDLLAKLSNETGTYSFPPVIVYTARDLTPEEEDKLRLYSGSIIIKGAKSPERLLSEVTLFLHKVETELPLERQKMLKDLRSREKNLEGRTILVADDDVRNIFALTAALEDHGAKIITARNGREAIDKLSPSVDLILMDIMMPEMDGLEAMALIRKEKKYKELPILALTAKVMKDDREKCLEAGANDYLPKPIEMDKLLSLIRVWLPQKRRFS